MDGSVRMTSDYRGEETRARLVAAAIELLAEHSWGEVSTRSVAERAGVNPALIHYHFRTLADLLRQAACAAFVTIFQGPSHRLFDATSLDEGLRAYVGSAGGVAERPARDPIPAVVMEATVRATRDPELAGPVIGVLNAWRAELATRLTAMVAAGDLVLPNPAAVAILVAALLDGLTLHRMLDPNLDLDAAAAALVDLLTRPARDTGDAA